MRDYKRKMDACRLSKDRYAELRRYCLAAEDDALIRSVANAVTGDQLADFIVHHVMARDYTMTKMEVDGMPCNRDTFRVYRARFFWLLNQRLLE